MASDSLRIEFWTLTQKSSCKFHPSIVCNCFTPLSGSWGFLLEPIPAVSGWGQSPAHCRGLTDGRCCTPGAIWNSSVSCSRTLRHVAQLSPAWTFRSLANLLYPLSYNRKKSHGQWQTCVTRLVLWAWLWQTFTVVSVEEWHVDDGGLLLFSLKHVAVLRPVSLLQNFLVYLW